MGIQYKKPYPIPQSSRMQRIMTFKNKTQDKPYLSQPKKETNQTKPKKNPYIATPDKNAARRKNPNQVKPKFPHSSHLVHNLGSQNTSVASTSTATRYRAYKWPTSDRTKDIMTRRQISRRVWPTWRKSTPSANAKSIYNEAI